MALIQETLKTSSKVALQKSFAEAMKDPCFVRLVKKLGLSREQAMKITSKLELSIQEGNRCASCKGLFACQNSLCGHLFCPFSREGRIYFSYTPCKYQLEKMKQQEEKEHRFHANLYARMKDIDVTGDKKRMGVIKWIDSFFQNYDYVTSDKGLYLYGNFGTGKTFLISALFHELESVKHVSAIQVYFPELLQTLKDDWELYENKMYELKRVDLLLFDDIGAEKVTEWGRDEVLGTILQYRMEHHLPTFFTSNMSLEELESHLALSNGREDVLKSRRILERIRQLAIPMELISENRRK